jgi:hypothetical protein
MPGLSALNKALNQIPKRAEAQAVESLRDTFVDSGVSTVLESVDHQVLYGRRGTGKTHALRYIESIVGTFDAVAVYVDLRVIGSPEGLFAGEELPATERTARLLIDLLGVIHDSLLAAALEDDGLMGDTTFVDALDGLLESITTVTVRGETEEQVHSGEQRAQANNASVGLHVGPTVAPKASARAGSSATHSTENTVTRTRRGHERLSLNFSDVARALRNVASSLGGRRVWLLLDEWSSVPTDIQPYLGAFLVRCVLPLPALTVKIAAIEHQTNFRTTTDQGMSIGIEVGADVSANVDLDEFMVFEQNQDVARQFFRGLFFKHVVAVTSASPILGTEADLIRDGFTDSRAFDELVRSAEGVPRDAINIAARAASHAGEQRISVPDVRWAAQRWFQTDKEAALRSREEATELLRWVIDEVIRGKRSRSFLVSQRHDKRPVLMSLFDARVLHLARRGYSAQDQPGERYDVFSIDYGAYVDLINTQAAPSGNLPAESDAGFVDVPTPDLRTIRRAILDLDEFERRQ